MFDKHSSLDHMQNSDNYKWEIITSMMNLVREFHDTGIFNSTSSGFLKRCLAPARLSKARMSVPMVNVSFERCRLSILSSLGGSISRGMAVCKIMHFPTR